MSAATGNPWMDRISALSLGEKLIGAGAILMFFASLLDWATVSINWDVFREGFGSLIDEAVVRRELEIYADENGIAGNGWGAPGGSWSILAVLVSIVLGAVIGARVANARLPQLAPNLTWGQVFAGGAAAIGAFMVLKAWRILALDEGEHCPEGECSLGFGIGFFLAVVAAAAIGLGAYILYMQEQGRPTFWDSRRQTP